MKKILLILGIFLISGPLSAWEMPNSVRSGVEGYDPATQVQDPRETLIAVPTFVTDSREDKLMYFPCTNCHNPDGIKPNRKVRPLQDMHAEVNLVHGGGRFWCVTCHNDERNYLASMKNQKISFNESHLLCGQCHSARQKDFFFGAHGKRKDNWEGTKRLTNCTECHNPHNPSIRRRTPRVAPVPRRGLEPMKESTHKPHKVWEPKTNH